MTAEEGTVFWAGYIAPRRLTWPAGVADAARMWELVGVTPERRPDVRLLDVACGSGVRSFGLLAATRPRRDRHRPGPRHRPRRRRRDGRRRPGRAASR